MFAADVDGDGDVDVLSTAVHQPRSVFAADMDSDGDTDVLSASYSDGKIAWYENDGGENFTQHTISTNAAVARTVFAADMDGDGDTDVISPVNGIFSLNKIAWHENDGSGDFTLHTLDTPSAASPNSLFAADVDGDGDLDVLSASPSDNSIAWHENLHSDFGDAPDSYLTLDASGGAKHKFATNLFLGATHGEEDRDGFGDGMEGSPNTASDDDREGLADDDEDFVGKVIVLNVAATIFSMDLSLSNTTGANANLVGWIDFDDSGFFDPDEASTAIVASGATMATLTWDNIGTTGPDIVVAGSTFARFRLTTDNITGHDPGGAASDGEVEDHEVVQRLIQDHMHREFGDGDVDIVDFGALAERFNPFGRKQIPSWADGRVQPAVWAISRTMEPQACLRRRRPRGIEMCDERSLKPLCWMPTSQRTRVR